MNIIFALLVVALVYAVPIKIGAHVVGAEKRHFLDCLLAGGVISFLQRGADTYVSHEAAGLGLVVVVGAYLISAMLETTYIKGLVISVLAKATLFGFILLLGFNGVAISS